MQYIIVFLEGVITFISPCLLPMLPVYVSYFIGGEADGNQSRALKNALGFVLGFTIFFVAMGAFAGSVGRWLLLHQTAVNIVSGLLVVVLGLHYMGFLKIGFLNRTVRLQGPEQKNGFFSSLLFGAVFSIGWTPCVGAFLGSALLLASQQGSALTGTAMLFFYSLGLGLPFLISAVLLDKLKGAFAFIKRHYRAVNIAAGGFLVLTGVLMMTGLFGRMLSALSV